jgi:hypothetical protein
MDVALTAAVTLEDYTSDKLVSKYSWFDRELADDFFTGSASRNNKMPQVQLTELVTISVTSRTA